MRYEKSSAGRLDFVGALLEGTLDIPLTRLTIEKAGRIFATGFGRIYTDGPDPALDAYVTLMPRICTREPFQTEWIPFVKSSDMFLVTAEGGSRQYSARFARNLESWTRRLDQICAI